MSGFLLLCGGWRGCGKVDRRGGGRGTGTVLRFTEHDGCSSGDGSQ